MRLDGISIVDKPKLTKILQAIDSQNLPAMYGALRDTDESLRDSFLRYLALNNVPGGHLAVKKLETTIDPGAAVRAGALCLLATKVAGN